MLSVDPSMSVLVTPTTSEFGHQISIITGRPELRGLIYQSSVRRPEGYLTKPVTEESLLLAVRKCLEVRH